MANKPEAFNIDSLTSLAAEIIALRNLGVTVAYVLSVNLDYTSLSSMAEQLKNKITYSEGAAAKAQAELRLAVQAAGCESNEFMGWIRESRQLRKLIQNGALRHETQPHDDDHDNGE